MTEIFNLVNLHQRDEVTNEFNSIERYHYRTFLTVMKRLTASIYDFWVSSFALIAVLPINIAAPPPFSVLSILSLLIIVSVLAVIILMSVVHFVNHITADFFKNTLALALKIKLYFRR